MKFLLIIFFTTLAFGTNLTIIKGGKNVSHIENGSFAHIPLTNIKPHHLKHQTKSENIDSLVEKGLESERINFVEQYSIKERFAKLTDGDKHLLFCLQKNSCNIEDFPKAMNNDLHKYFAYLHPAQNIQNIYRASGNVAEYVMIKYYEKSGWKRIEGGYTSTQGIDGLFIKKNSNGSIKDVLIVESKYNTSDLGSRVACGTQMSKDCLKDIANKLDEKFGSVTEEYKIIKKFIDNDTYRARIWNMNLSNNQILISQKNIHSKGGEIKKINLKGGEKTKIDYSDNQKIEIANPKNNSHLQIIALLEEAKKHFGETIN